MLYLMLIACGTPPDTDSTADTDSPPAVLHSYVVPPGERAPFGGMDAGPWWVEHCEMAGDVLRCDPVTQDYGTYDGILCERAGYSPGACTVGRPEEEEVWITVWWIR